MAFHDWPNSHPLHPPAAAAPAGRAQHSHRDRCSVPLESYVVEPAYWRVKLQFAGRSEVGEESFDLRMSQLSDSLGT